MLIVPQCGICPFLESIQDRLPLIKFKQLAAILYVLMIANLSLEPHKPAEFVTKSFFPEGFWKRVICINVLLRLRSGYIDRGIQFPLFKAVVLFMGNFYSYGKFKYANKYDIRAGQPK